jgi:RES domain
MLAGAPVDGEGGPLFVPRALQGSSRHDNPDRYGALYSSRVPESAVAERLQAFRGRTLTRAHLRRPDGRVYALARIDESQVQGLVDLDDPRQLSRRGLRPSHVATGDRAVTRPIALAIYEEGVDGLAWWSALEASWTNVTLFLERSLPRLSVADAPQPLDLHSAVVERAADRLGVALGT